MRRSATVPVAVNSATQIGAGTSPPAGNVIEIVMALPDNVPVSVPFLTLWHDPHVPSDGSTALISEVPDSEVPDCTITQVTSSGLNESDPIPVHVPFSATGPGREGDGADGGGGAGAAGLGAVVSAGGIDPHATSHAANAASKTMFVVFMRHASMVDATTSISRRTRAGAGRACRRRSEENGALRMTPITRHCA